MNNLRCVDFSVAALRKTQEYLRGIRVSREMINADIFNKGFKKEKKMEKKATRSLEIQKTRNGFIVTERSFEAGYSVLDDCISCESMESMLLVIKKLFTEKPECKCGK